MTTRRQLLATIPAAAGAFFAIPRTQAAAGDSAMTREAQRDMTPDEAIAALQAGNERFVNGKIHQRDLIGRKQLKVVGAMHEVATGQATFCRL